MLRMRPTDEHGAEAINGLMQLMKDGASLVRFEGVLNPLPIPNDEEDDGKPAFDMTAFKAGPSARLTAADFLAGRKPPPWCRVGRDVFYFRNDVQPWLLRRKRAPLHPKGACNERI